MRTQLVIFALEGVIVDSLRLVAEAQAEVLRVVGVEISPDELVEDYRGLPFKDILLKLEERSPLPLQASLIGAADTAVEQRIREMRGVDGVRSTLAHLGAPFDAVSLHDRKRTEKILKAAGLDQIFAGRIDVFDPANPKSLKDLLLQAAAAATPEACVVVDTTPAGIIAAREAGMRAVGFTGGEATYPGLADALTEAGAETVISRMSALPRTLAALGEWSEPA